MQQNREFTPHSIEAEQALLGAVLLNNDAFFAVTDLVEAEHFFEPLHERIWGIFEHDISAGHIASPVTVSAVMGEDAVIDIGGMTIRQYVARLAAEATPIINAPDYARTIRSTWGRRRAIALAKEMHVRALRGEDDEPIDEIMSDADQAIEAIRFGKKSATIAWLGDHAKKAVEQTAAAYQKEVPLGYDTGIKGIDEIIGPILPGHYTLIAPSGHGKTALAMQVLERVSEPSLDANRGRPSMLVSMEMKGVPISRRALAGETGITTQKQATGAIREADYESLASAANKLAGVNVLLDEAGPQTGTQIEKKIRAMHKRHNICMVVIDHMRLYMPENPRWSPVETIERNALRFQKLAGDLDISIWQLAQLKADAQTGDTWRITINDIFGGGMVRQCSDVVLAVVQPSIWFREREPEKPPAGVPSKEWDNWQTESAKWEGKAEASGLKMRSGETGARRVIGFDGPKVKFF